MDERNLSGKCSKFSKDRQLTYLPYLKCLALTIPEIAWGPNFLKNKSRDRYIVLIVLW